MPMITEIKAAYGKTINLGNYESARLDVELSAKLMPGESSQEAIEDLQAMAKKKVSDEIKRNDF